MFSFSVKAVVHVCIALNERTDIPVSNAGSSERGGPAEINEVVLDSQTDPQRRIPLLLSRLPITVLWLG